MFEMKSILLLIAVQIILIIFDLTSKEKEKLENTVSNNIDLDCSPKVEVKKIYLEPVEHTYTSRREAIERRKEEFDIWKSNCKEVDVVLSRLRRAY